MSFWNGTEWVAETPVPPKRPSRTKRVAAATLEAALITALTFGLIAGSVFAGKGGNGGGKGKPSAGTHSLTVVMVQDMNTNGSPNWHETITYDVTSTSSTPYVSTRCFQNGTLVYAADAGFYPDYPWPGARNMPLYSPSWTGGGADCKAYVNNALTLTFQVGA